MNRISTFTISVLLAAFAAQFTQAQCFWSQPWDKRHASHTSIVESCDVPRPFDIVAMDDFVCEEGGELNALRWWGTIYTRKQYRNRPYYIAIYADNGNCQPGQKLYEACVKPKTKFVGRDCLGDYVIQFTTRIPPFFAAPGRHYWLQISEDDAGSARQGVEDFRWSGRVPIQLCPAAQMDVAGGFRQPLFDACDEEPVDLSFIIAGI